MKRICNDQNLIHLNRTLKLTSLESTTITLLCNLGSSQEPKEPIFKDRLDKDYSFYSKLLHLCVEKRAQKEGKLVHCHVISNGLYSNPIVSTKLIIFYSRIGDMFSACNVFDGMIEKSVVSWTALLSGYSQNGYPNEALSVFSEMRKVGVRANQFTYGSALRACTSMMCLDIGKQIHGCVAKSWLVNNLFVQSALVDLHSKCGSVEDACYVFESMSERDVVSWNAMLGGYASQGCADEAFRLFSSMLRGGIVPDTFTFGSVMKVSTRARGLTRVVQIHGFIIKLGFEQHNVLAGSLVDAYMKFRKLHIASSIYKSMRKGDKISCTALITGYARECIYRTDAFYLFNEIHRMNIIDNIILCSMLNICAKGALLDNGKQVHALALKHQPNHDTALGNALIDMYSKSGEIEDAKRVFNMMEKKNVISWTSLIGGYGKHGCGYQAIDLYHKMGNQGIEPNDITFLTLLFACSHAGLITEGWEFFNIMVRKYNIAPRSQHYSCLVDLLARGGKLNEAYDLICEMNIKPTASLWGSILGACRVYGDTGLGEKVGSCLLHIVPEMSVNYVVLGNIYAAAGLWDNVLKTRKIMEERNLRKDPGYSLFQNTKNKVLLLQARNIEEISRDTSHLVSTTGIRKDGGPHTSEL